VVVAREGIEIVSAPMPPVRLDARLDGEPSSGLWLVKWLLLIPHLIVLSVLWLAFMALTVIAMFAILFTGRYPRSIFEFNVGVMRWTWRVSFYGYGALGTDRYPPFSLGEEPDYPATLHVPYPAELSRGLALVKWWLLAVPHYLVVAFFLGGGGYVLWQWGNAWWGPSGGLITLLTIFAGVALLFTNRYPRGIFDFVMGMNRWAFRVAAYAGLMTDSYPPFRLDLGGPDVTPVTSPAAEPVTEPGQEPVTEPDQGRLPAHAGRTGHWTAGRVVAVVIGALLVLTGLGATAGGGVLLWADTTQRDSDRFVTSGVERFTDSGYAVRFDGNLLYQDFRTPGALDWLGDVRIRAFPADGAPLFAGIARTSDVARYLDAVPHNRVNDNDRYQTSRMGSNRPPDSPAAQNFWVVSDSGGEPLTLRWEPQQGEWSLVVMNADAGTGVRTDLDIGATAPALRPVALSVLGGGLVLLALGALLIALAARSRRAAA
jgi:hypothetical protein